MTTTHYHRTRNQPIYQSVQAAWLGSLSELLDHGENVTGVIQTTSVGSNFGHRIRDFRELVSTSFIIEAPRRRLTLSTHRPIDLGYAFANCLWVLSGSDDLGQIQVYNPRAKLFSDDGSTLSGATGARIFYSSAGNQFEQVALRLRKDPPTRRAVINVYLPGDLFCESRDCPCLTHLQFLLRDGALTCIANMRSQSVLMVMPYDLVLLTMLHEAMSVWLGVTLGPYIHNCGSFHYYLDEQEIVRCVINENSPTPFEMPPMISFNQDISDNLREAEQILRSNLTSHPTMPVDFDGFGLDSYWSGVFAVIASGFRRRNGYPTIQDEVVPEDYLPLLRTRR